MALLWPGILAGRTLKASLEEGTIVSVNAPAKSVYRRHALYSSPDGARKYGPDGTASVELAAKIVIFEESRENSTESPSRP